MDTLLRWCCVDDVGPLGSVAEMADAHGARRIGSTIRATLRKHDPGGWLRLEAWRTRQLRLEAGLPEFDDAVAERYAAGSEV